MSERAETGPMKFGDDWTGVFIRGDNAMGFALHLETALVALAAGSAVDPLALSSCASLAALLREADEGVTRLSYAQMMRPFTESVRP